MVIALFVLKKVDIVVHCYVDDLLLFFEREGLISETLKKPNNKFSVNDL